MTQFTTKWKADKAAKKLEVARQVLLPDEEVWFFGYCNSFRPPVTEFAMTSLRIVTLMGTDLEFSARYGEIASLETDKKKQIVDITCHDGRSVTLKFIPRADHDLIFHFYQFGMQTPPPPGLAEMADAADAERAAAEDRQSAARDLSWPQTKVKGKISRKASEAILRQCGPDEHPWLILTSSGGAGSLVAWDDRLAIVKTGAMTSFMAGSLGGERSATFHYSDITGIEYNSGFVNGVLEVLTASYSGSANRDFWRGSASSRNADSNDPWTLSNCLPLAKPEYNQALSEINELKARISTSKQSTVQVLAPESRTGEGLADQLHKLGELKESGILSDEEFAAAKARLLGQS